MNYLACVPKYYEVPDELIAVLVPSVGKLHRGLFGILEPMWPPIERA